MKNVITILGGVLTIVSMFIAFASGGGISITGMDYVKLADGAWVASNKHYLVVVDLCSSRYQYPNFAHSPL